MFLRSELSRQKEIRVRHSGGKPHSTILIPRVAVVVVANWVRGKSAVELIWRS